MNDYDKTGYKVNEQRMYSETVYYDIEGNEVERTRWHDDHLYDDDGREELTEFDMENYYG